MSAAEAFDDRRIPLPPGLDYNHGCLVGIRCTVAATGTLPWIFAAHVFGVSDPYRTPQLHLHYLSGEIEVIPVYTSAAAAAAGDQQRLNRRYAEVLCDNDSDAVTEAHCTTSRFSLTESGTYRYSDEQWDELGDGLLLTPQSRRRVGQRSFRGVIAARPEDPANPRRIVVFSHTVADLTYM